MEITFLVANFISESDERTKLSDKIRTFLCLLESQK